MDIRKQKRHLRDSISQRITRLAGKNKSAESRSLCKRILENLPRKDASIHGAPPQPPLTIAAYVPLKSEADILPLLHQFLKRGDPLYLPVFKNNMLTFRKTEDLQLLKPGTLNILEPPESAPELDPLKLDFALVPARAFDRKGWRLGRGNGGYDKWIRSQRLLNPKTKFWGIALECQIVNEMPREEHDEKVDQIITARGFVIR